MCIICIYTISRLSISIHTVARDAWVPAFYFPPRSNQVEKSRHKEPVYLGAKKNFRNIIRNIFHFQVNLCKTKVLAMTWFKYMM